MATTKSTVRVAMVGAGYFAWFHADAWSRISGVELAAICDREPGKAAELARPYPGTRAFQDLDEMLASVPVHLIDIATPPPTHAGLVRSVLGRGLDAVCQKPFCTSLAEAEETVRFADRTGRLLVVHENFRFEPWYRRIKEVLDAGEIGEVYQISFRLRPGDGQGPGAYLSRQPYFQKMPRFLIRETAIHFVDVFRYLLGEVTAVSADLRRLNPVIAGEDAGLVVFEFAGGRRALFDGNRLADHPADDRRLTMGEMWIDGARGALRLDGFGRVWLRASGKNSEAELSFDWENRGYGGDCVYHCLAHVARHLIDGTAIENTGRDYLANLRIEEVIYRSDAEQRRITLAQ